MAAQANFLLSRERRQGLFFLVTDSALLLNLAGLIEWPPWGSASLIMGIVTAAAVVIAFRTYDLFISVPPIGQIFQDIIMAGRTLLHSEEIS